MAFLFSRSKQRNHAELVKSTKDLVQKLVTEEQLTPKVHWRFHYPSLSVLTEMADRRGLGSPFGTHESRTPGDARYSPDFHEGSVQLC